MKKIKGITFAAVLASIMLVAGLACFACSPKQPTPSSGDSTETAAVDIASGQCAWKTGFQKDVSGLVLVGDEKVDVRTMCMSCHSTDSASSVGMSWDIVVKATSDWKGEADMNPHSSHLGSVQCDICHMDGHALVMYCNNCHTMAM